MSQSDSIAISAPVNWWGRTGAILPGLGLSACLTALALALRHLPMLSAISPAILAILLGMAARQVIGLPASLKPGLTFSMRTLLRCAVVLLGLQVTFGRILALGLPALLAVAAGLLVCFFGTLWLGARLGVERKLARLIGTGTAICGASAVVAANSVTRGHDEDVAYALAAVTIFGTLAMLAQPAAAIALHLEPDVAGLWLGASIHEVAQVVGAATQLGSDVTNTATVAKMVRILLLAPMVLGMAAYERRRDAQAHHAKVPVPWFVFGFLILVGVASAGLASPVVTASAGWASSAMLAAALAAMGFGIEIGALRRKGMRPLILAAASWCLIVGVSFALLRWVA